MFSLLHRSGIKEEPKRHDIAVEQLQVTKAEWSQKRTEHLDWINEELCCQNHAVQTFRDVDAAMHECNRVTGKPLDPLGSQPLLPDFYTPSNSQKYYEIAFIILGMAAMGPVTHKLAK